MIWVIATASSRCVEEVLLPLLKDESFIPTDEEVALFDELSRRLHRLANEASRGMSKCMERRVVKP